MKNTFIYGTTTHAVDIGTRVVKWDEPNGLSFVKTGKFSNLFANDMDQLQKKIKQFAIHWSVTYNAKVCYNVLRARGLSCNFSIDDDCDENGFATIYQHLPICYAGWSQGKHKGQSLNRIGTGVEICYMPQRWEADMYDENDRKKHKVPEHEDTMAKVHGTKMKVHLPTKAQMNSLKSLMWGFSELFPDLPAEFPKDSSGEHITTVLKDPVGHKGFVTHYQLRRAKIDPAGIDLDDVEKDVKKMKELGYNFIRDEYYQDGEWK